MLAKTSPESWRKHSISASTKKLTKPRKKTNLNQSTTNKFASFSTISSDEDSLSSNDLNMHVTRPFFVKLIFSPQCKRRALIDTGAFCSAMSNSMFESISESSYSTICQKLDPPSYKVSVASRSKVEVLFQADIKFNIGNKKFTERFLILPDMNDILLGLPFFRQKQCWSRLQTQTAKILGLHIFYPFSSK